MRIGVDLGGTKIEAIVLDDDGGEHARIRIPSPQGDYTKTISAIRDLVADVSKIAGCDRQTKVGVGIPGATSPKTGLVKNANSTWLIGHSLERDLCDALARDVRIANDANCFAISEAADGAGKDCNVVFGVILGTGVGGGIAINGSPLTGRNAITGEWGHNPMPWPNTESELPGPSCYCGKTGCIETFLSGPGLQHDHASTGGENISSTEIVSRAEKGDTEAVATMQRYADRLARALSGVINIVDPDIIVLGGGLSNIASLYEDVPKLLGRYVFSDVCETPLVKNIHGDSSGVRGAAWLWYNS